MSSQENMRVSIGARRNPETEAAVLDAAEAILAEKGFHALTMEAVAKRARAGKATLYRWWPSRGRLILAVYKRRKGDFRHPDTGSLQSDLSHLFAALFAFWSTPEGDLFRLLIAAAQIEDDVAQALAGYRDERRQGIRMMIERAKTRNELQPDLNIDTAADIIMGVAWMHLITRNLDADCDLMARTICQNWTCKAPC